MPAASPEALDRKRQRRKQLRQEKKRASASPTIAVKSPNRKWLVGPPAPPMSKSELREMFAQAVRNTQSINP